MAAAGDVRRDDAVLVSTRLLSGFIVPFLLVAFVVLYPVPTATERWFAWTISPTMTPMVLASAYAGGAYFFVEAMRARAWHAIAIGFAPVTLFATSLGIATIVHWDKFNHDHIAFWLWSGLYFTTPVLVTAVWWRNARRRSAPRGDEPVISPLARAASGLAGISSLLLGLFLFLFPQRAIEFWPWTVTPLTTRVTGSVLMLGATGIGIYRDPRWTATRLLFDVARVMIGLILIGAVRARDEFITTRPLTWSLGIGLVLVFAGATALRDRMSRTSFRE